MAVFICTLAELERGIALGWHTSAQLYASLGGEALVRAGAHVERGRLVGRAERAA